MLLRLKTRHTRAKLAPATQVKSKARDAAQRKRAAALASAKGGGMIERGGDAAAQLDAEDGITNLDDLSASVQMRLSGVRAMGALAWRLQSTGGDASALVEQITALLSAPLGTHAQVSSSRVASSACRR